MAGTRHEDKTDPVAIVAPPLLIQGRCQRRSRRAGGRNLPTTLLMEFQQFTVQTQFAQFLCHEGILPIRAPATYGSVAVYGQRHQQGCG